MDRFIDMPLEELSNTDDNPDNEIFSLEEESWC
jgi:hypothetical protein